MEKNRDIKIKLELGKKPLNKYKEKYKIDKIEINERKNMRNRIEKI